MRWATGAVAFLIGLASSVPPVAFAQGRSEGPQADDPAEWTLPDLLDRLETANAQLRSARRGAEAARFGIEPARAPDNPSLSILQDPIRKSPVALQSSEGLVWTVSQSIPWPDKRRLAGEIAATQADQAIALSVASRLQLRTQLRSNWWSWQQIQDQIRLQEGLIERLENVKAIAQVRYANHAAAYADFINAQLVQAQARTDLVTLRTQEQTLLAQMNTLIGRAPQSPLMLLRQPIEADSSGPMGELQNWRETAVAQHPTLALARAQTDTARRAVDLALLGKRPDFSVSLSFHSATPPWGVTNVNAYGVGVGVTFPLWYGRKEGPLLAQAREQQEAALASEESTRQQVLLAVESAWLQWQQASEQLRLLETRVLDQARIAWRLALGNYGSGQVGYLDLMSAWTALRGAELSAIQARGLVVQSRLALEAAAGGAQ